MKDYTNSDPVFSKTLKIIETSDQVHADIVNEPLTQLLQNTLVLEEYIEEICDETNIEAIFYQIYTNVQASDPTAMTAHEIEVSLATKWNGETSEDETAMTAEDVETATTTKWNGETSEDDNALQADDISSVIGNVTN